MKEKIENFKSMSLEKQKEILLIVMWKSIDKSDGIKKLYDVVDSVDTDKQLDVIKQEFIKIYTFLMEAVEYINSKKLKDSFNTLDRVNETLSKMKEEEKNEMENDDIDELLERELMNI